MLKHLRWLAPSAGLANRRKASSSHLLRGGGAGLSLRSQSLPQHSHSPWCYDDDLFCSSSCGETTVKIKIKIKIPLTWPSPSPRFCRRGDVARNTLAPTIPFLTHWHLEQILNLDLNRKKLSKKSRAVSITIINYNINIHCLFTELWNLRSYIGLDLCNSPSTWEADGQSLN